MGKDEGGKVKFNLCQRKKNGQVLFKSNKTREGRGSVIYWSVLWNRSPCEETVLVKDSSEKSFDSRYQYKYTNTNWIAYCFFKGNDNQLCVQLFQLCVMFAMTAGKIHVFQKSTVKTFNLYFQPQSELWTRIHLGRWWNGWQWPRPGLTYFADSVRTH